VLIFWKGFGLAPVLIFLGVAVAVNWDAFFNDGKPLGELRWSPVLLLTSLLTYALHTYLERVSSQANREAFMARVLDRSVGHRHSLYGLGLPVWAVLCFGLGVWAWISSR
jgi:hypothetical protein